MVHARRMLALLTALLLAGSSAAWASPDHRAQVVGGGPAPTTYTWVTALLAPGKGPQADRQFCGGSLIAPTWVLTAAHCAQVFQLQPGGTVLVGRTDLAATGGEEIGIRTVKRHPSWNGVAGTAGDVALLELERASTTAPAPYMTKALEPPWEGQSATVLGWGSTVASHGGYAYLLQQASFPILDGNECARYLGTAFNEILLLCGGTFKVTACDGDSGGPLLVTDNRGRLSIAGVVSFGPRTCGAGPGFFVRVSGFADWIAESSAAAPPPTPTPPGTTPAAPAAYSLLAADGTVHSFGAPALGSPGACRAARSCADLAGRPGGGYWVSRGSCEVSGFGSAPAVTAPVTEERCTIAAHREGRGLWALTPSGRVFSIGGVPAHGHARPRTGGAWTQIGARPQGDGYWLLASDGAVSGFGAARALPAAGGRLSAGAANLAPTASGLGYWLVGRDGSVAAFGDATVHGSAAGRRLGAPIVDLQPTSTGAGYWLFGADGAVLAFGDAKVVGSAVGKAGPVVAAVRR